MIRLSRILLAVAVVPAALFVGRLHDHALGTGIHANEFQLLTGFSAKEACSCVFVVGQTDTYCTAFGQQPGYDVTVTIDHTAQTVTSTYLTSTRTARVATTGTGCALDPL